jgi:hypothetical protein
MKPGRPEKQTNLSIFRSETTLSLAAGKAREKNRKFAVFTFRNNGKPCGATVQRVRAVNKHGGRR